MKLVSFGDEPRVGVLDGDEISVLDVPTMREYFERGGADETGERVALDETRLRAPIVPKKFFHTAGNFREHEEESKQVDWSHEIAPWIVFFQNVDAIVGPDEPVVYPEHLTEELDYELELAVILRKPGRWFSPEEAADYIGGYVIFNDITARDIQRREMRSGVFSFCKAIDTFCPLGPWIVTPDEIPDPHDLAMDAPGERRDEADVALGPDVGDDSGDLEPLLGARILGRRRPLDGDRLRCRGFLSRCRVALPQARRRHGMRDRAHRRAPQPGDLVAGGARRAGASARAMVRRGDADLNILVGAVGLSALGDWLALVPLTLNLQEATGSGFTIALLYIAFWAPSVVLAGPAGLLADRYDPRRVLLVVSLAQASVAVVLAFAAGTALILVLAALLGIGFAVAQPAEFALVPRVAGEARLALANGRVETARYAGFAVGPLIGGMIAAAGGLEVAMLVNAATFLVVGGAAIIVRCPHSEFCLAPEPPVGRAWTGAKYLVQDRVLAVVMTVAFVSLLFMTTNWAANVFFAKDDLGLGDVGYGLMLTSWTAGMVLGATLLPRRFASGVLAAGALVAIVIQGLGLAGPAVWLVPALAFGFFFVGGLAHGTKNVLIRTLIHERVPSSLHGRAFAAYNGLRNAAELVALVAGGVLVSTVGARWTMLIAGAIPVAAGLVALAVTRRRLAEPAFSEARA